MSNDLKSLLQKYHSARPHDPLGRFKGFQKQYKRDPSGFVRDCLKWKDGEGPADYQDDILNLLVDNERVTVRAARGGGKTALASWFTLWWSLVHDGEEDWKVATMASNWRQVEDFFWPEVHWSAFKLKWDKIGREPFSESAELFKLSLQLKTGRAMGMSSDKSSALEGLHSSALGVVLDEAKSINQSTYDSMEGSFSTSGKIRIFMISTPGPPVGYFYDAHNGSPGFEDWVVRHVTCEESIKAGRITQKWVDKERARLGENSAMFKNHCLGEFATSDEDGLIPTHWIQLATDRWKALDAQGAFDNIIPDQIGVDVARSGSDSTCRAFRLGNWVYNIERTGKQSTMETAGIVKLDLARGGKAVVDVNGVGAGVYDRLVENEAADVAPFMGQSKTELRDLSGQQGFANLRSAALWKVREWLDPENGHDAALFPDETVRQDLSAPTWSTNSTGNIAVETKEKIKARLKRSPDSGDAVMMSIVEVDDAEVEFF